MSDRQLVIMNLISHEGRGGADRLALNVSKGLKRRGHRVIWGCPSNCYLIDEARAAGLEIHILDFSGSLDMAPLSGFMRFCKEEKIDIVNVHHSHGRHLLIAARLLGLRSKAVFTRHCISEAIPYAGMFLYNLVLDMNIAVSNVVRESLLRGGILPGKAATVYGGVDIKQFEHVPAEQVEGLRDQYVQKGRFTIGIVARLQHGKKFSPEEATLKGHEVLFQAVGGLSEDASVLVLGPWLEEDKEKLRLIAHHCGLGAGKVIFCGFQEDMAPFYRIMDLNVLPSPREGLGLTMIEAMAAGVPCIGADGGGIREIISNGVEGFLFRPGDSADLAAKIRTVLGDKELRERFISEGREKVRRQFDIEKTVRETEKVFLDLLG